MKVFFSASPRALKSSRENFQKIFYGIEKLGHENLSNIVVDNNVNEFYQFNNTRRKKYFLETMKNIRKSDVVVVEASIHSLAIGYIVEKALELSKHVIVFHTKNNEPFFFSGNDNERLQIIEYSNENILVLLKDALDYASSLRNIRFNIIFTNQMFNFLNKSAKEKNISKASYIRSLINNQMPQSHS